MIVCRQARHHFPWNSCGIYNLGIMRYRSGYLVFIFIFPMFICLLSHVSSLVSSPELAQGELLGYRDVRRPSYVWTSVTSETYETSETSVRQLFSLCTL